MDSCRNRLSDLAGTNVRSEDKPDCAEGSANSHVAHAYTEVLQHLAFQVLRFNDVENDGGGEE